IFEKLPFFALAAASSAVTFFAQNKGGSVIPDDVIPFTSRVANAVVAYPTYLLKTFWPRDLVVFYQHPITWPAWQLWGSLLLLICISVVVLLLHKSRQYLLVGWLWYLGTLVPVI